MEAILGVVENRVGVVFENLFADFFAPLGGQAMEHDVTRRSVRE